MRVLSWIFAGCALAVSALAAEPRVETGEIEGAKFAWMAPAHWNHAVLLIAHGYRAESAPLVADLSPTHAAYRRLWESGWLVAKTSYRRNGVVLRDAVADLDNLRSEIARRFGAPERVIVEGDSMGGLIALLIAERTPDVSPLYQGVVAVDPALDLRDPREDFSGLQMQPKIPVVFLCNRDESEGARHYIRVPMPKAARPFVPALLRVNRDGHVNINQAERFAALRLLNEWIEDGSDHVSLPDPTKDYLDVTRIPEPLPSKVFFDEDHQGFTAHVTEISGVFGNLLLDAQPKDFADTGLTPNAYFRITIRGRAYRVWFGKDFNSVKNRGQWIAFPNADGFFWLGRNHANAASTTSAQLGDLVHVRLYDAGNGPDAEDPATDAAP